MDLPLEKTLRDAWQKVMGAKGIMWVGICIYLLIIVPIFFLNSIFDNFLLDLLTDLLLTLFNAGLLYLGIKRAQGSPIHYQQIFYPLNPGIILRLVVAAIAKYIITLIPIMIFILLVGLLLRLFPASRETIFILAKPIGLAVVVISLLYLQIRMMLSTAFILDRYTDFWSAIQLSFKATRGHTWNLFLFFLFTLAVIIISAIPFGIGLIWSLPFSFILYGKLYKKLAAPAIKSTPQKRVFDA